MVSYYNSATMYRHQQAVTSQGGQFHGGGPMHGWYSGYHQSAAAAAAAAAAPYSCMQDEQQMWHAAAAVAGPPHGVFQDFPDYGIPVPPHVHQHQQHPQQQQQQQTQQHPQQLTHLEHETLPSPPITVSGSELSSPGANSGHLSPSNQTRPPPARSPYEWMKKASYQCHPNPGKTRTKDKYRVVYTDHQRVELEKEFYYSRYITIRRKAELAATLGLSERQVKIWFQNRRAKERKQVKKRGDFAHKDNATGVTLQQQQQQHQEQQQQQQQMIHAQHNQHNQQIIM